MNNTALFNTLLSIAGIPKEEAEKLLQVATPVSIKKGSVFIQVGTTPHKFAFVNSGLFCYYYRNEKGSEFVKGFFPENNFIVSYTAMARSHPSYYTIEALEDSEILVIEYTSWKKLQQENACWNFFLLALLEKGYIKKEARERELLLLNAEERYRIFLKEYPHLENRVKQHHIASYLGITPVALSRVRKAMGMS